MSSITLRTILALVLPLSVIAMSSCGKDIPPGTLENIDKGNNKNIEVYRYYYDENSFVYIARFKDSPQVQSTTYNEYIGRNNETKASIIISGKDTVFFIDAHEDY
jgi:hypothetical protein